MSHPKPQGQGWQGYRELISMSDFEFTQTVLPSFYIEFTENLSHILPPPFNLILSPTDETRKQVWVDTGACVRYRCFCICTNYFSGCMKRRKIQRISLKNGGKT